MPRMPCSARAKATTDSSWVHTRGAVLSPNGMCVNWYSSPSKRKQKYLRTAGCSGKDRKQLDRSSLPYQQFGCEASTASSTELYVKYLYSRWSLRLRDRSMTRRGFLLGLMMTCSG